MGIGACSVFSDDSDDDFENVSAYGNYDASDVEPEKLGEPSPREPHWS